MHWLNLTHNNCTFAPQYKKSFVIDGFKTIFQKEKDRRFS